MKSLSRIFSILFIMSICAPPACANDFLFSEASIVVVGPAFLLWVLAGLILILSGRRVKFLGWASVILIMLMVSIGHPEIALTFWMIYLALLTTYFAAGLRGSRDSNRFLNLIYHGTFLLIVIGGGAIAKAVYWSRMGGFSRWSAWMREIYLPFLIPIGIMAIICSCWVSYWNWQRNRPSHSDGMEPPQ